MATFEPDDGDAIVVDVWASAMPGSSMALVIARNARRR